MKIGKCDVCGDEAIMHWMEEDRCCEREQCLETLLAWRTLRGLESWEETARAMRVSHLKYVTHL